MKFLELDVDNVRGEKWTHYDLQLFQHAVARRKLQRYVRVGFGQPDWLFMRLAAAMYQVFQVLGRTGGGPRDEISKVTGVDRTSAYDGRRPERPAAVLM